MKKRAPPKKLEPELSREESQRLKAIWNEKKASLGLTQQRIADAIGDGVTQGAVSHYLNGTNTLNLAVAAVFARELRVRIGDFSPRLQREADAIAATRQVADANTSPYVIQGWVPLISYVQAGQWSEAVDLYEPGYAEHVQPTAARHSRHTFALRVDGHSMTLPAGVEGKSFPHGVIIYVDPMRACIPGDYVVARLLATNNVTFKRLGTEEGRPVLIPLNPNYPIIHDEFEIIGRVIDASWGGL